MKRPLFVLGSLPSTKGSFLLLLSGSGPRDLDSGTSTGEEGRLPEDFWDLPQAREGRFRASPGRVASGTPARTSEAGVWRGTGTSRRRTPSALLPRERPGVVVGGGPVPNRGVSPRLRRETFHVDRVPKSLGTTSDDSVSTSAAGEEVSTGARPQDSTSERVEARNGHPRDRRCGRPGRCPS